jgi:hypothetical protein
MPSAPSLRLRPAYFAASVAAPRHVMPESLDLTAAAKTAHMFSTAANRGSFLVDGRRAAEDHAVPVPPATEAAMKIIVRPVMDPDREIDVTRQIVSAVAQELCRCCGGNQTVHWLEAKLHVQGLMRQDGHRSRVPALVLNARANTAMMQEFLRGAASGGGGGVAPEGLAPRRGCRVDPRPPLIPGAGPARASDHFPPRVRAKLSQVVAGRSDPAQGCGSRRAARDRDCNQ